MSRNLSFVLTCFLTPNQVPGFARVDSFPRTLFRIYQIQTFESSSISTHCGVLRVSGDFKGERAIVMNWSGRPSLGKRTNWQHANSSFIRRRDGLVW